MKGTLDDRSDERNKETEKSQIHTVRYYLKLFWTLNNFCVPTFLIPAQRAKNFNFRFKRDPSRRPSSFLFYPFNFFNQYIHTLRFVQLFQAMTSLQRGHIFWSQC